MGWESKRSYPTDVSTKVTVQARAGQKARWKRAAKKRGLASAGAFLAFAADIFLEMEDAYNKQVDRHLDECNPPARTYR